MNGCIAQAIAEPNELTTFVDGLLAEHRELTAVDQFARLHECGRFDERERRYRNLLPATPPGPGQQFAFEVDLDKCSGCKACVTACHSLNGLDEGETWRNVGLLISQPSTATGRPLLQHVTTACHHCADPGCLNGCPVLAYDKDPSTGIVRHLDDQCIGCSYCIMKCPYDVPKYSKSLGIVRKCDLCSNRLAVGEAPACAQACPNEAIKITLVGRGEHAENRMPNADRSPNSRNPNNGGGRSVFGSRDSFGLRFSNFGTPPAFPDSSITQPTTRFVTKRPHLALAQAADAWELRPAPAHPPLSVMLVLTQLGVGASAAAVVFSPTSALLAWLSLCATAAGVGAATLHLGQPMKAWRGFLGWRRSWLSRELLAFGAVMGAMGLHALALQLPTAWAAFLTGFGAVFCSAMIYVDTRREFWSARFTFPKFALTTMVLGTASAVLLGVVTDQAAVFAAAAGILIVVTLGKLLLEIGFVWWAIKVGQASRLSANSLTRGEGTQAAQQARASRGSLEPESLLPEASTGAIAEAVPGSITKPTGRLMTGQRPVLLKSALLHLKVFRTQLGIRVALGVVGGLLLPILLLAGVVPAAWPLAGAALLLCVLGEMLERHLFFVCEAAPRMPGGLAA